MAKLRLDFFKKINIDLSMESMEIIEESDVDLSMELIDSDVELIQEIDGTGANVNTFCDFVSYHSGLERGFTP